MHPVLFRFPEAWPFIGGLALHTYGLMIALGFLLGMLYVKMESERTGLDPQKTLDLFFWVMVGGILGARVFYIINSVDHFWSDPLVFFKVWEGGLVFQGGVIGALIVAIIFIRKNQMPFFKTTDVFAPPLALGHALGRIGCFFAGCCFGKQCDPDEFPFAVIFPHNHETVAPPGIPLYPTQLMESLGEFLLFFFLLFYRKKKPFDGAVFLIYLIVYSVLRSIMEVLRGDVIRGFVIEPYLSVAQLISLLTIIVASFLWVYLRKNARG